MIYQLLGAILGSASVSALLTFPLARWVNTSLAR